MRRSISAIRAGHWRAVWPISAELKAYASTLKDLGKGTIEIIINRRVDAITPEECDLLDMLLTASGRQITWLVLRKFVHAPEAYQRNAPRRRRRNQTRCASATCHHGIDRRIQFPPAVTGLGAVPLVEAGLQRDAGGTEGAL